MRRWRAIGSGFGAALCLALACKGGGGHGGGGAPTMGTTGTACAEIFALGFRNPWRMNFDPNTHALYVGDVGQSAEEEIDIVDAGKNYGWDCMEGELVHTVDPSPSCSTTPASAFTAPEVVHDRNDAEAIAGGVVYRGSSPDLFGFYVYGDFITNKFFAFDADAPGAASQQITQLNAPVVAFGQARDGKIYAVTFGSPSIREIVPNGSGLAGLSFGDAFPSRSFTNPVKLVQHPTDDDRWYVVEQGGLVKTFLTTDTNAPTIAANVGASVSLGSGEQGLLGMAFDPNFTNSGEVYLSYTNAGQGGRLELARWKSSNGGLTFTADSVVLNIPHPTYPNHNGSDIMFGVDGFLYYSTGDGGGADDPFNNGQNASVLLGKILRIDVNATPPAGRKYAIPASNPNAANPQCG